LRVELRTLGYDLWTFICYIFIFLYWFQIPHVSFITRVVTFIFVMLGLTYFGVYRNHNYTEAAYKNQGRMYIDQGKMASNLDVFE
jgi:hypothetical protein